ncbi:hypothetical protein [Caballeronia sp. LZ043]|uniref:hypothetical protein n=1 Tax=Caballeronia sp. LZ043 TaxID=3038569 RepID=UPI002864476F|nr:hypothetical protein [Caballeronia sp. LZ043]MDR5825805.1 hypothetical protein [Caballeronia sp. LZ043]
MSFFGLDSPNDILQKAKRERARLAEKIDVDNIFNFFVTVNHIHDYVDRRAEVTKAHHQVLRARPAMKLARDICNTAKHVELTHSATVEGSVYQNSMFAAPSEPSTSVLRRSIGYSTAMESSSGLLFWQTKCFAFGINFSCNTASEMLQSLEAYGIVQAVGRSLAQRKARSVRAARAFCISVYRLPFV